MASALANRAIGAIVGSAVADAAGNNSKLHSVCPYLFILLVNVISINNKISLTLWCRLKSSIGPNMTAKPFGLLCVYAD